MDITRDQQIALDDALVAPANRLKIGKSNLRLSSDLNSKEATLQVVYDVLKLTPFYKAFQITADVPEIYMQEFWATATVHHHSIRFKMNNKKHIVNLEYFREMLQICPKLPDQQFEELPFEEEILTFLRDLGHSGEIKVITDVNVNKLHQPWRSFAASERKVNKFDFVIEDGKHIHLTKEQINQQKKIEEEAKAEVAKHESEVRKEDLVDLLGLEVVNKKGSITLKVYREDGTSEIIPNFKASDLHLSEWREVMNACPNITRKGWTTNYGQIRIRMDYIHTTEVELGINLDIPLSEQDPLDKLNDFANKKRKHVDDIHDYFKANKRLKSSIQYEDHLAGTVLNEPVLGMIMFNSYHRQDFVTIEDLKDFPNTMMYIVQEIFFRRHQGPGLDDHARTFSSLLHVEVDKRNLNLLKHIRVIEQPRQ
ncbi:hypothetical protein Tco_0582952 [Tanacetum coccineum]